MSGPCAFEAPACRGRSGAPLAPGEITSTVVLTLALGASGIKNGQTSSDEREDLWERLCVYVKHRAVGDTVDVCVARLI